MNCKCHDFRRVGGQGNLRAIDMALIGLDGVDQQFLAHQFRQVDIAARGPGEGALRAAHRLQPADQVIDIFIDIAMAGCR